MEQLESILDGYLNLAIAIVERCVLDYREALYLHDHELIRKCESFLNSTGPMRYANVDGKAIMEYIKNEYYEKGILQ